METLEGFRNVHRGGTILVCGLGPSLEELQDPSEFTTIGVNDIGRHFTPNYLVVLNREDQFSPERFRWIRDARPQAVFTCLDLDLHHPRLVRFNLGEFGGTDVQTPGTLPFTKNSPYVATCLAMVMGAKRIGIIGVDFTDDHHFRRTGPHPLTRDVWEINRQYERLRKSAQASGIELLNLSPSSRIDALPRVRLESLQGDPSLTIRNPSPSRISGTDLGSPP